MRLLRIGAIVLLAVLLLLLLWGVVVEPYRVDVREVTAEIPHLPASWDGAEVAVIGDLQVGMWLDNTSAVREVARRIVRRQPVLVLIVGDFVYHPIGAESPEEAREEVESEDGREVRSKVDQAVELLRPLLGAGLPVYAVLGNHDYAMGTREDAKRGWVAERVERTLEAAGVRVLENEAVPVLREPGGEPLHLVGIDSLYAGEARPREALAGLPEDAPRVVFMHNPDLFSELPAGSASLVIAGHTHGGQIRLPFKPAWSWMALFADDEIHVDGWVEGRGGNRLYVNRGMGFSLVPIRIHAAPELTLVTLRAASPARAERQTPDSAGPRAAPQ